MIETPGQSQPPATEGMAEKVGGAEATTLAAILDALPATIVLLDAGGCIVAVNESWRRFVRANVLPVREYGLGLNYLVICDAVLGDDSSQAERAAAGIQAVLAGSSDRFSLEYSFPATSEERWFLMTATPLAGGGPAGVVVMHADVSDRKQAERKLIEGRQRFDGIVTSAMDAIISVDADGGIVLANPAAQAMFGYAAAELQGQRLDLLIPQRFRAGHASHMDAFGVAGVTSRRMGALRPVSGLRKNGEEFLIEASISTDHSTGGASFTAILRDITDRKRVEADLAKAHRELVETSRQAGMAEVATSVLHNVGNVLNSVNVSAQLAIEIVKGSKASALDRVVALLNEHEGDFGRLFGSDQKGRQLQVFLAQLAERLHEERATTIRELESLSEHVDRIKQIVSTQQSVAQVSGLRELLDLRELVEDSLSMVADSLKRHGIEVVRDFSELPPVEVEKHKVLQTLVSLLHNARFACAESGRPHRRLTLRVTRADGCAQIAVSDNGIGIEPGNLTRIFSLGFATGNDGHGFGLHRGALAAREMGGSLEVHSEGPDHGSTFVLTLPLQSTDSSNRGIGR